jgi:hypothetical protein
MPRNAINYNNTTIYKLCCNDLTVKDIYVGHTTNFTKRKANHKRSINTPTDSEHNTYKYNFIRNNGGWNNWSMIEIIKMVCTGVNDACRVERQYIEQLNATLNKNRPIITPTEKAEREKEWNKEYYHENKEKLNGLHREYYQENKEKISESRKEYYQENKEKIKDYIKTKRHKNLLLSNSSTDDESS